MLKCSEYDTKVTWKTNLVIHAICESLLIIYNHSFSINHNNIIQINLKMFQIINYVKQHLINFKL